MRDQDTRLSLPLVVNNSFSVSLSIGGINGLQVNGLQELDNVGEVGRNVKLGGFVSIIINVPVVGMPHSVPLLAGFLEL